MIMYQTIIYYHHNYNEKSNIKSPTISKDLPNINGKDSQEEEYDG